MNQTVGVYGKIPAQADFVRGNVGEFSRLGLDRWFQEAHEVVHNERGRLPNAPACFALAQPGTRTLVLGAMARSEDPAGRVFPIIVFGLVDAMPDSVPAVPQAYGRVFAGGIAALEGVASASAADLGARCAALADTLVREPTADAHASLAHEGLAPLGVPLGGLPHGAAYALRTVLSG